MYVISLLTLNFAASSVFISEIAQIASLVGFYLYILINYIAIIKEPINKSCLQGAYK